MTARSRLILILPLVCAVLVAAPRGRDTHARGHTVRRTVIFPEAAAPLEVTVRLP